MTVSRTHAAIAGAAALAFAALAVTLRPPPNQPVSEWADEHVMVPSGSSPYPGPWRTAKVPFGRRIMDVMGVNHPAPMVAVRAGVQSAKTTFLTVSEEHMIATDPGPGLIVLPTGDERAKFEDDKLWPFLNAAPDVALRVLPRRSRTEGGSSAGVVKFRGGSLRLTHAGSAKGLQMISVRSVDLDEVSSFDRDVDGQGDPVDQAFKRAWAYEQIGAKKRAVSTPKEVGDCRITELVEAGTFELFYVPCPHCDAWQHLEFEAMDAVEIGRASCRERV